MVKSKEKAKFFSASKTQTFSLGRNERKEKIFFRRNKNRLLMILYIFNLIKMTRFHLIIYDFYFSNKLKYFYFITQQEI